MDSFEGVVSGEPGAFAFADATLRVGKKSHVEKRAGSTFVLRLDNDTEVRIEGVESAEKRGRILLQGAYGTLLDASVAKLFAKRAPGDHVKVEIRGFALCEGDRVRVEGTVLETASALAAGDEGGMREAPKRVPSVVRAERLIIEGNTPEPAEGKPHVSALTAHVTQPSPRRKPPSLRPLGTSTRVYAALGLVLTLGSIALSFGELAVWRNWLSPAFAFGLIFLTMAIIRRLRGVNHAPYVSAVGGAQLSKPSAIWGYGVEFPVFVMGFAFFAFVPVFESRPSTVVTCTCAAALLPLIHGLILLAQERAFRRFGRLVLFAQPSAGEGRMARFEGSVREDEPGALQREVSFVVKSETSTRTGKSGHSYGSTTSTIVDSVNTHGKAFVLKTPEGEHRVVPQGAQIAFASRHWKHGATTGYDERSSTHADMLVVGRIMDGAIEQGGDESMFLWVGSRMQLWRSWLVAWLRPLAYFAFATGLGWLAFHVMPFAEIWHVQGSAAPTASEMPTCDAYVIRYLYSDSPHCSVHLTCDGEALYGGYGMGQMTCSGSPESMLEAADDDASDGDPALRFSISQAGPGQVSWHTGSQSAHLYMGAAERTLWH